MSAVGAEAALEAAVLAALQGDAGVRAVLGDPVRAHDGREGRPAYPWLEIARHERVAADSAERPASEHRLDLRIHSREHDRTEAQAALAAVRAALAAADLDAAGLAAAGWRCVLAFPGFSDVLRADDGRRVRAVLRVRAIIEPG